MTIHLLFIGDLFIHKNDFLPFLNNHGYDVTVVETSTVYTPPKRIAGTEIEVENLYNSRLARRLFRGNVGWFTKAGVYTLFGSTRLFSNRVQKIIKQKDIDIIYGSWGSPDLPEMRMVQELGLPVVYEFLAYPYFERFFLEKVENAFNNRTICRLDGRIVPTERMLNYLKSTFSIRYGENIVFPELYSEQCFYRKRLPRLSDSDCEPHIIFLGISSYGSEISSQFEEILRRRIHVHVCETSDYAKMLRKSKYNGFFHTFREFDEAELYCGSFATFMTQFDACLVTYNSSKGTTLNRIYNSVPNRFSFAFTGGIPIIMPYGYLLGCEEIVDKNQTGFTYRNYDDLKEKLSNIDLMAYYRNNAIRNKKIYTLENNFEKIDGFLKKCLEHHKQGTTISAR